MSTDDKRRVLINIFFIATILALVLLGIRYALPLFVPFVTGLIIAIILQKPVAFLTAKAKGGRKIWSTLLVVLLLILIIAVIGTLGFYLYNQVAAFAVKLQDYVPVLTDAFRSIGAKFTLLKSRLPDSVSNAVEGLPAQVASTAAQALSGWVGSFAVGFVSGLPTFLITFIFSILSGVFITSDYNKITAFVLRQFREERREFIFKAKSLFVENILKMARGYLIIMVITFFEMLIALSILGVDYVVVLALFISIVDLLPVLGVGTVLVPWGAIAIIIGNIWLGVGLLVTYVIVLIIRNIIEPRIIGKQVGLPPLVTLTAMYIGMRLYGLLGLFLFPLTVIVIVKLKESGMIHLWN